MKDDLKDKLAKSLFRFKKAGVLTPPDLDINLGELFILKRVKDYENLDNKDFSLAEIREHLNITRPAVSQMLNSLEKKGYILREINSIDRRKYSIKITFKGLEVMKTMREFTDNMFYKIIERFGEENTVQLIYLFDRFTNISEELNNELQDNNKGDIKE